MPERVIRGRWDAFSLAPITNALFFSVHKAANRHCMGGGIENAQ